MLYGNTMPMNDKAAFKARFSAKKTPVKIKSASEKSDWLTKLGHTLRDERKRRKLSQSDVADTLLVNRSTISNIENGNHKGSLKPLIKYLDLFKFELIAQPTSKGLPLLGDNEAFEDELND